MEVVYVFKYGNRIAAQFTGRSVKWRGLLRLSFTDIYSRRHAIDFRSNHLARRLSRCPKMERAAPRQEQARAVPETPPRKECLGARHIDPAFFSIYVIAYMCVRVHNWSVPYDVTACDDTSRLGSLLWYRLRTAAECF